MFQLGAFFGSAYLKASTPTIAVNGFKKTGIYPLDRDVFDDHDFAPSAVTDQAPGPTAEATSSVQPVSSTTAISQPISTIPVIQPSTDNLQLNHPTKDKGNC